MSKIVVGVDGSAESAHALAWAVAEGRLRQVPVDVVYAYDFTPEWQKFASGGTIEGLAFDTPENARSAEESARQHGEELLNQMIGEVAGIDNDERSPVKGFVVDDSRPARYLVEHSDGALMLVVGSRGRGTFQGLVLGSVSQYCAHHATCPVVIVRGDNDLG